MFYNRRVYDTLAMGLRASHNVTTAEIQDLVPLSTNDYPTIKYWQKCEHQKEKNRWDEFARAGKEPRHRGHKPKAKSKDKNVNFWHFQHKDGTELSGKEVAEICAEMKRTLCNKHGPMGSPWMLISPIRQLEYYLKIKAKYPIL